MKVTVLFIILAGFVSCFDMDETVYSDYTVEEIYKTEEDADVAVMGIYSSMLNTSIYELEEMLGNITTTADTRYIYVVSGGIHQETPSLENFWAINYTLIRKANEVIENLWKSALPDDIKQPYIAEAMALRCYGYFRLLRLWGDIPFRVLQKDHWTSDFEVTPMADIYRSIISELEWSASKVWDADEKPRGRIDKEGVKMILADVYLTCASSARAYVSSTSAAALKPYNTAFNDVKETYWRRVKELCEEVIASSYYMEDDWTKLWGYSKDHDSRFNKEHIWTSQVVPGKIGSLTMFRYTPTYSEYCPAQAVGERFLTYNWANSFDRDDIRFTEGIIWEYTDRRYAPHTNGYTYVEVWRRDLDNKELIPSGNIRTDNTLMKIWRYNSYQRLQAKKFYDMTYTVANNSIGPAIQMPYYRVAEAYLFYAEAENELMSCTQAAVDKINAVRMRANVRPYSEGEFSREQFRERIIDEREWEFAREGKALYNMLRTGTLEQRSYGVEVTWNGDGGQENPRPRTADNYWLPYPLSERITNSALRNKERMNYKQ